MIPPCSFCWDREAVWEVMTRWDCWASLCADCTAKYATGRVEPRLLKAGAAMEPLPTAAEAGAYVESQEWTRARPEFRGRPQAPHEYVLIWKSTSPWTQLRVLAFIRATGGAPQVGTPLPPLLDAGVLRVSGDASPGDDPEPAPPGLA